jgi:D-alanyl-D-alanine carboxypeptidase/D-alanyl-D-alanine-endopeptidase (penicillin-binding protein 4)
MHRRVFTRRSPLWLSFALFLGCVCAGPGFASERASALSGRLDRVLQLPGIRGAKVSALVVVEATGEVLYSREPDRPLIPASNVKILTALVSLDAFGPTHQIETRVLSDGPPDGAGKVGNLYLIGGGDPAVNSEDWWRLAADLRNAGLRRVAGDLVLDDTALDRVRWHPTVRGRSSRAYHAPVGALTANYGSFAVTVRPGKKVGDPVIVNIDPPVSYLTLSNLGTTIPAKRRRTLVVDRSAGSGFEQVEVRGSLRVGDEPKTYYRSVLNPTRYAGSVMQMQLQSLGVEIAGEIRVAKAPEDAFELHVHKGRPLAEIIRLFVKYSNNAIAETLVKNLGAMASGGVGTWQEGAPEMRRRLIALGLDPQSFQLVDGSGLSYENRVTARALVRALMLAGRSFRIGPEVISALPISARDGTLEKRAEGSIDRVRAKTGLLNQVTALSGFAEVPLGQVGNKGDVTLRRVVFSIMVNGYRHTDEAAMDAVDEFVSVLTGGGAGSASR